MDDRGDSPGVARTMRLLGWVIVGLMALALAYAAGISWVHWEGIGV